MKTRPFLIRCAAILLILVFSQKSGTGLFIHSLLHTGNKAGEIPLKQSDQDKHLGYACTCIDDFLMPFTEEKEPDAVQPVFYGAVPFIYFKEHISFHASHYSSLRGPPALTS